MIVGLTYEEYAEQGRFHGEANAARYFSECANADSAEVNMWWNGFRVRIDTEIDVMLAAGIKAADALNFATSSWSAVKDLTSGSAR